MATTTNYGLYVTEPNEDPTFKSWRGALCGNTESNMTKIDAALGEKAQKSNFIDSVLTSDGWVQSGSSYTQTITVTGLDENTNGVVGLSNEATEAQREIVRKAMLCVASQEDGQLTILADGDVPTVDIPISVIIIG